MKISLLLAAAVATTTVAAVPLVRELNHGKKTAENVTTPAIKPGVPVEDISPNRRRPRQTSGVQFTSTPRMNLAAYADSPELKRRVAASNVKLRGVLIDNSLWWDYPSAQEKPYGVYEFSPSAGAPEYEAVKLDQRMYAMDAIYTGDRLWISNAIEDPNTFQVTSMTYYTFDPQSWAVLKEQPGDKTLSMIATTWDEADEGAYVLYSSNYTTFKFAYFDVNDGQLIDLGTAPKRLTALASHTDGTLYGMDDAGDLVVVNKLTGKNLRTVGNTGLVSYYRTSAALDPVNNILYYVNVGSSVTSLYAIDIETAATTKLYDFDHAEQFLGLYITEDTTDPNVPGAGTDLTLNFPGAALEGSLSFTAPATLYNGSTPSGSLTYKVSVDGEEKASASCAWGANCNVPLTFAAAGRHEFAVTFSNAAGEGPAVKMSRWIGPDAPSAPTGAKISYANGAFTVSWTAPTEGANGGLLDPASLTYEVVRNNDNAVVATGISATLFTDPVEEPVNNVVAYTYTITPYSHGLPGESVTTGKKSIGYIIPPYTNDFDNSDKIAGYTTLDANGDGKKWAYNSSSKAMRIIYNSSKDMDDYLFTPEIMLEAGKTYAFGFDARAHNNTDHERVEAVISTGTSASSVVTKIIDPVELVSTTWVTLSGTFTPSATGRYRLGIHAISDKNSYYLYVTNVSISAGAEVASPAPVSDLTAAPGDNGNHSATISFTAPSTNQTGETISSLSKIELSRNGELLNTWTAPAPGSALTFTDTEAPAGNVVYSVTAFNEVGASAPASVSAFIGFDIPLAPTNLDVAAGEDSGRAVVTWTVPAADIRGTALTPQALTYTVVRRTSATSMVVAEELSETTFTDQAAATTDEQEFFYYEVYATTEAGNGQAAVSPLIPLGKPYEIPFRESFANGRISAIWGIDSSSPTAGWMLGQDTSVDGISSEDGDNGIAIMEAMSKGSTATLYSGAIAIPAIGNPTLTFAYYNHNSQNTLKVIVAPVGSATGTQVASVALSAAQPEGWVNVPVALDAFKGQNVQIYFVAEVVNTSIFVLDNIRVENRYDNDLAVRALSMPARLAAGADYAVNVIIENKGINPAAGYTVELLVNNNVVATKEGSALQPAQSANLTFDCLLPATTDLEPLTHYVNINYPADLDMSNNTSAEYVATPYVNEFPAVGNLQASVEGTDVTLTWDEPDLTVSPMQAVTESAEDFTPFSTGLAGSVVFDDYVGDWTMIDNDGVVPYPITSGGNEVTFPNSGLPVGFMVFNPSQLNFSEEWAPHTGENMFVSLASDFAPNDDWMISPYLSGKEQTISFWAKSLTDYYGAESFQVWYSTTDTRLSSFMRIETIDEVPTEWTKYEYTLPEGARYFAIRCTSSNTFALLVDDITYTPAHPTEGLVLTGYNLYRNDSKVATCVAEGSYLDTDVPTGQHRYRVSALYNRGESQLSAPLLVAVTALRDVNVGTLGAVGLDRAIRVVGAQGRSVRVVNAAGIVIYDAVAGEDAILIPAQSGIYVVTAADKSFKITVK